MNYDEPLFRPPSEAQSLIFQATIGCSHNQCAFCGMYKTKKFRVKDFSELKEEILDASLRWPDVRRVFLADGDALALPTDHLVQILDLLDESFPHLSRIGIYANASNVLSKSDQDLQRFMEKKIKIAYVGLESGNDDILTEMHKGSTAAEMTEAVQRCQNNGIKVSVMVLLGLGGVDKTQEHAVDTAAVLNQMNPRFLSFLSVIPVEGTLLDRRIKKGTFIELNPTQILDEMKRIILDLKLDGTIFRSNHASNYLALAGRFPQDKERLLDEIENALKGTGILRDEWERGL